MKSRTKISINEKLHEFYEEALIENKTDEFNFVVLKKILNRKIIN
jgi:hypothetical protein